MKLNKLFTRLLMSGKVEMMNWDAYKQLADRWYEATSTSYISNNKRREIMNKHMYMAVAISLMAGLYIPKPLQLIVTLMIITSMVTYMFTKSDEFFWHKKSRQC